MRSQGLSLGLLSINLHDADGLSPLLDSVWGMSSRHIRWSPLKEQDRQDERYRKGDLLAWLT